MNYDINAVVRPFDPNTYLCSKKLNMIHSLEGKIVTLVKELGTLKHEVNAMVTSLYHTRRLGYKRPLPTMITMLSRKMGTGY